MVLGDNSRLDGSWRRDASPFRQHEEDVSQMQRWDLTARRDSGRAGPRVLFSTPEVRGVVIDLAPGEQLRDHHVRERALIQILRGSVEVSSGEEVSVCSEGMLILFEREERRGITALGQARLFLVLAPWPAPDHYYEAEHKDAHQLPVNATQDPC
jgi:quercetin dioxygenase-like cupin family protein